MTKIFAVLSLALAPSLAACIDEVTLVDEPVAQENGASMEGECGPQPLKLYTFEEWNQRDAFPDHVRRAALVVEHYEEAGDKARVTIYGVDTGEKQLVFALDAPEEAEATAIQGVIRGRLQETDDADIVAQVKDRANHVIVLMTSTPTPPPPRPSGGEWLVRSWDILDLAMAHAQIELPVDSVCPAF